MIRSLYCVVRQAAVLAVPSLLGDLTSASKERDFFFVVYRYFMIFSFSFVIYHRYCI